MGSEAALAEGERRVGTSVRRSTTCGDMRVGLVSQTYSLILRDFFNMEPWGRRYGDRRRRRVQPSSFWVFLEAAKQRKGGYMLTLSTHKTHWLLAHNFISIFCHRGRATNDQSWKGSSLDWVYRRSTCCCEVVWMDWLPSKEMYDLVITVTIIKHIQRSRGREDLQEITSDNVDFWPHGKYKCELRFIKRRHVYKTSSAFNSPFCNTAKLRDNTKSKLLKDISNGAQKTSPTSFSLSNLFLVFKSN